MKHFFAVISVAALGFLPAASYGQNLLTNGSFEVGFGFASIGAGSTNLPGWTISGDKDLYWVTPAGGDVLVPLDGSHYVDLNGAGGIIALSQSFPTTPGNLYVVAFNVGFAQPTNGGVPDFLTAKVTASDGVGLGSASAYAPNVRGWASPTRFQFVATTISSTLHFTDSSGTVNYDLTLDNASVVPLPHAQPVSHLTMHLFQLQANWLSFTSGNKPETFSLLSSDGDFIIYSGNASLQGSSGGGDDASGSLLFPGPFTELSWTSAFGTNTTGSTAEDGIRLQLSVTAEARPLLSIHSLGAQQAQLMWETNFAAYVLESTTVLPPTNWVAVTNSVDLSGEHFTVAVNAQEPARFFRLRRN